MSGLISIFSWEGFFESFFSGVWKGLTKNGLIKFLKKVEEFESGGFSSIKGEKTLKLILLSSIELLLLFPCSGFLFLLSFLLSFLLLLLLLLLLFLLLLLLCFHLTF